MIEFTEKSFLSEMRKSTQHIYKEVEEKRKCKIEEEQYDTRENLSFFF